MPQEHLINPRLTKSHLQVADIPAAHLEILAAWRDSIENRSIFRQNETSLDGLFIQKILVEVLGYQDFDGKARSVWKNKPVGSGNVDVALGNFAAGDDKILAVFELKGAKTKDLDAIMPGRHKSPVQQAWEYAMDAPGAAWVLVSNYLEIRLYAVGYGRQAFEVWDLTKLTDPAEYARLQWLVSAKQLLSGESAKILAQSTQLEKEITNQLYRDYKALRETLLRTLTADNPAIPPLDLLRHAQTILDRILFIAFAEDRGLLPDKTIAHAYQHSDPYNPRPVWENFKGLFRAIDKGNAALKIPAYNGGLFQADPVLESLVVSDELCEAFKNLAEYDFASEVSVTVLGHIFEQSISDIEGLQAEALGEAGGVSKRKKDGIFYTPAYITRYIVEQAVGGWLNDRKQEIGFDDLPELTDQDYESIKIIQSGKRKGAIDYNDNIKRHIEAWEAYKTALSNIKVLDPACGSGAFLTEVFDYLYQEGQTVNNQLAELNAGQITLFKWDTHILANNLYGVDINQESIEITKLSLWLKTANRQEKLTYLDDNIKCGNSLIDDPDIAGDKAFKWDVEFSDIMQAGGFDVVVGNPPYIKESINKNAFDGLHSNPCYQGKMDIWYFFGCLSLRICKQSTSKIAYIATNNWITNDGASNFRNTILKKGKIFEIIDFIDYKVFDSADIQTMIIIMSRNNDNEHYSFKYRRIAENEENSVKLFTDKRELSFYSFDALIDKSALVNKPFNFSDNEVSVVLEKISAKSNFSLEDSEIASGIDILQDFVNKKHKSVIENAEIGDGIFNLSHKEAEFLPITEKEKLLLKPFFTTSELRRYFGINKNRYWVIYTDSKFRQPESMADYPNLKKHLDRFQEIITSVNKPYGLHRARDEKYFKGEKIFSLRKCPNKPVFTYTDFDAYVNRTFMIIKTSRISQKYLTGLLNSNIFAFWLKHKGKMQGTNYQIDKNPLLNLPIYQPQNEQGQKIENNVSQIIDINRKLIDYSMLLEKSKKEYDFEREIRLQKEIDKFNADLISLESEINSMVYALYGLTEDEIRLVEENQ